MKTNEKELYEAPLTMSLKIVVAQIICSSLNATLELELDEMTEEEYKFEI
ncbi:MAG: hypothetical protein IJ627_01640 [Bacteroidales bacterium]|nr:hypothetical protein [Bacteroidales bacterium]